MLGILSESMGNFYRYVPVGAEGKIFLQGVSPFEGFVMLWKNAN